jgi:hypothetical protein
MTKHTPLDQLIPRTTPALLRELEALAHAGQVVPAIHRLRNVSGMSLRWCRDMVFALSENDRAALASLSAQAHLPSMAELHVRAALARGRRDEARQLLTEHTGWGTETITAYLGDG